jgi:hypothetical protein
MTTITRRQLLETIEAMESYQDGIPESLEAIDDFVAAKQSIIDLAGYGEDNDIVDMEDDKMGDLDLVDVLSEIADNNTPYMNYELCEWFQRGNWEVVDEYVQNMGQSDTSIIDVIKYAYCWNLSNTMMDLVRYAHKVSSESQA